MRQARFPEDTEAVRQVFRDYQADINVDLCFQSFEEELAGLPGRYVCVLLADGGCVGLRPYSASTVELKRLFVYPQARGRGLGLLLMHAAIERSLELGYTKMHLDTLKTKMPSAVRMYEALGFEEVPAGGGTTLPDLVDMELDLVLFSAKQRGTKEAGST
ncbi:MAG: GNAT family N-acetyltransferase [Acidobacteria bacterium]|nr:GNAT family N-acetyltransferase [Acidobacteriota bacterium]